MPLPTAQKVGDLWRESDTALSEERRNYWLNTAFYLGQQWVWWDTQRGIVQLQADRVSETDRARTTINRIRPSIDSLMGRLANRNLSFEAQVSGVDDVTIRGGRLAEFICEHERIERDWENARLETIFNCLMGGTAAIFAEWDTQAGDVVATDPDNGTPLHLGHSTVTPVSIAEFTLESDSRKMVDARWAIRQTLMTPGQAKERYGLDKEPETATSAALSPLQRRLMALQGNSNSNTKLVTALTYYERPGPNEPGGVLTIIEDRVVAQAEQWPYPFPHLPLRVFRCAPLPLKWTGDTFVTTGRPIQVAYNNVRSTILEHARLTANARLLIPHGSMDDDDDLTTEVGELVRYYADAGKPEYLSPPVLQRWLSQEADRLSAELDDVLHTHGTSRGEMTGDRNSGLAMSLVSERDDSPLGVMSRDQAQGWGQVASMTLKLYEANAIERRTSTVTTDRGTPIARDWSGDDLHGQTNVTVPLDQTSPRSRVATQAMITNLAQAFPQVFQTMDLAHLSRMLDLPRGDLVSTSADSNVTRAEWENEMMAQGKAIVPEEWHDHATHIREHNEFRNTPAYELLPEPVKGIFEMHQQAHEMMSHEEIAGQAALEQQGIGLSTMPQAHAPMGSSTNPADALPPPMSSPASGPAALPPGAGAPAQEGSNVGPQPAPVG